MHAVEWLLGAHKILRDRWFVYSHLLPLSFL